MMILLVIPSVSQVRIDSLYPLLSSQSNGRIINNTLEGFFIIGHGTDTNPFNSLGSVFTSFNLDGTVNFSKYTHDPNKKRLYQDVNSVIIDSSVYTVFVGTAPFQIMQFNLYTGEIIHRIELSNASGHPSHPFQCSIHQIDENHLLVNSAVLNLNEQLITQLTVCDLQTDSLIFYFNEYLDYTQHITDVEITENGYILSGFIRKGDSWSLEYDAHATVVWLDHNFEETRRYISDNALYEQWGYDMIRDNEGSIISTTCIGQKYYDGFYYFDIWRPSIYKIDSSGNFLWQRPMGRDLYLDWNYDFKCLIPSNSGDGYIAAGSQSNFSASTYYSGVDTNEIGENLRFEGLIAKISNEGDSLWSRFYYKADFLFSRSNFSDMISHPEGGYILCGSANKGPLDQISTAIYTWVLYVDEYGCALPGCHEIVKSDDPSLPDPIRIYPNPASTELYVYQQENDLISYAIATLSGQIIAEFKNSQAGATAIVDISQYTPGEYLLIKKVSDGRIRTEKWLKL